MATYAELSSITNEAEYQSFIDKVRVAVTVKAADIIDTATPNAGLLDWAKTAINSPAAQSKAVAFYVIAKNKDVALASILTASDAAIQTNVGAAIDALYTTV